MRGRKKVVIFFFLQASAKSYKYNTLLKSKLQKFQFINILIFQLVLWCSLHISQGVTESGAFHWRQTKVTYEWRHKLVKLYNKTIKDNYLKQTLLQFIHFILPAFPFLGHCEAEDMLDRSQVHYFWNGLFLAIWIFGFLNLHHLNWLNFLHTIFTYKYTYL